MLDIHKNNTRTIDLSGAEFGRLTVIEFSGFTSHNPRAATWKCRCKCGKERVARASRLTRGRVTACEDCGKEAGHKRTAATRSTVDAAFNRIFMSYHKNAQVKGYEFSLTKDDARGLMLANCIYCGTPPTREARRKRSAQSGFFYNGLDRQDNHVGYVNGNVVTSCRDCNFAKGSKSVGEFLSWAKRLANFQAGRT